jgi:hypothetical protein
MSAPFHIINWIFLPKFSIAQYSIYVLYWGAPTLDTFPPYFYFPYFRFLWLCRIAMTSQALIVSSAPKLFHLLPSRGANARFHWNRKRTLSSKSQTHAFNEIANARFHWNRKRTLSLKSRLCQRSFMKKNPVVIRVIHMNNRVARWYIFKPKFPIWVNFVGSCNERCR